MKNYKFIFIIAAIMLPVFTFAQQSHPSAKDLMQDKVMQDSIMMMISNDDQLMSNMSMHIMKNKKAMHTMMKNKDMMKNMMDTAGKDSAMCRSMMGMMKENKNMQEMMHRMMNNPRANDKKMKDSTDKNPGHNH